MWGLPDSDSLWVWFLSENSDCLVAVSDSLHVHGAFFAEQSGGCMCAAWMTGYALAEQYLCKTIPVYRVCLNRTILCTYCFVLCLVVTAACILIECY